MAKTTSKRSKAMRPTEIAMRLTDMNSGTDLYGSYTGKPKYKGDKPVQDADDL